VHTWGKQEDFYRHNILLTKGLIDCAKQSAVQQFIYVSCASVVMNHPQALLQIDESIPLTKQTHLPYSYSKAIAEDYVLKANAATFKTIALRPAFIWGQGDIIDRQIGPASLRGKFGWFNHGEYLFSTCYIENLKEAVALSLQADYSGEAYFITDGPALTFRNFMEKRLQISKFPIPSMSFPNRFAWAFARFTENGWNYLPLSGTPPITREMVRLTGYPFTLAIDKAALQLAYQPKYSVSSAFEHLSGLLPKHLNV
jgi:nucleoside-diphosphate-sugar epimerase